MALKPSPERIAVVTGAYSYTGAAVARSLMQRGYTVRTLTNRSVPIGRQDVALETHPLQFADIDSLVGAMAGADVFVNTYWVRYPYVGTEFDQAIRNSGVLFAAAKEAGVRRIVQVSVSNASLASPLAYYQGKAQVEALLAQSGVSYAVVRPTLVVGEHDILVNNIAWFMRRFPVFALPGDGCFGDCFAKACARAGFAPRPLNMVDYCGAMDLVEAGRAVALCKPTLRPVPGVSVIPLANGPLRWRHLLGWHPESRVAALGPELVWQAEQAYAETVRRTPRYAAWLARNRDLVADPLAA